MKIEAGTQVLVEVFGQHKVSEHSVDVGNRLEMGKVLDREAFLADNRQRQEAKRIIENFPAHWVPINLGIHVIVRPCDLVCVAPDRVAV